MKLSLDMTPADRREWQKRIAYWEEVLGDMGIAERITAYKQK